jgi:hypothetical protein
MAHEIRESDLTCPICKRMAQAVRAVRKVLAIYQITDGNFLIGLRCGGCYVVDTPAGNDELLEHVTEAIMNRLEMDGRMVADNGMQKAIGTAVSAYLENIQKGGGKNDPDRD